MTALFIAFEGIEGSGKTTQLRRLAGHLSAAGERVVVTKEPGGTEIGERLRAVLLDPRHHGMDPLVELLLLAASRRQNVLEVIRPGLESDSVVLCDRFTDATLAYQGFGRLLELDRLRALNEWVTGGTFPDVTLLFDLPVAAGLGRARSRNDASPELLEESRFEGEDLRFHRRVREGYLALAESESSRFLVIDASGSADDVHARMIDALSLRFPELDLRGGAAQ